MSECEIPPNRLCGSPRRVKCPHPLHCSDAVRKRDPKLDPKYPCSLITPVEICIHKKNISKTSNSFQQTTAHYQETDRRFTVQISEEKG